MTQDTTGLGRFRVRIFSHDGGFKDADQAASSVEQLRLDLEAKGITLISAEAIVDSAKQRSSGRFSLLIFCQQLLSLLEAGLQLVEAIDTLTKKEQGPSQQKILLQIQAGLRSGLSFSQALAPFPKIFSPLFQATIEASEQTGGVADALKRFVTFESRFQALRSRVIGALIYPALLMSLAGLVVAFLLGYVVPRFSVFFVDRLADMPFMSAVVIRLGLAIEAHPMGALLLTLGILGALGLTFAQAAARQWLIATASRLPWLGERIRGYELVRIYRSLGMLLRGGIPAVRSLQMISGLAPMHSRSGIARVITAVSEGSPISVALEREGFTTVVSERLLAVGERSGQMGDMLERAADFLDDELGRSVDRAVRLMEPIMMVVIGGLIGGIVMLMYLPIFELANTVG